MGLRGIIGSNVVNECVTMGERGRLFFLICFTLVDFFDVSYFYDFKNVKRIKAVKLIFKLYISHICNTARPTNIIFL